MRNCSRRQFIKSTIAGAGLMAAAPSLIYGADTAPAAGSIKATDMVTLGRTGIKTSRLAQGTGFNGYRQSSELTRMGKPAFDKVVRHAVDEGVVFMDMADLYGTHSFVRDTIKDLPRDKFTMMTKLWPRKEDWNASSGGAKVELDRFRKELNVEMIDICLIHCMMEKDWADKFERIRDELSELKQKGVVRAVGVSCHHFGAMEVAASHPWVDLILARINYKGGAEYSMDGTAEQVSDVLKTARKNGKAVIGMKIFGAGKLVKPEEKDTSLKFVFNNNLVDAITIGTLKTSETDDTIARISKV
jgi:predicted aldo/keto reductase-like oxidoreductase